MIPSSPLLTTVDRFMIPVGLFASASALTQHQWLIAASCITSSAIIAAKLYIDRRVYSPKRQKPLRDHWGYFREQGRHLAPGQMALYTTAMPTPHVVAIKRYRAYLAVFKMPEESIRAAHTSQDNPGEHFTVEGREYTVYANTPFITEQYFAHRISTTPEGGRLYLSSAEPPTPLLRRFVFRLRIGAIVPTPDDLDEVITYMKSADDIVYA